MPENEHAAAWLVELSFVALLLLLVAPFPFFTNLFNDELTILSDGLRTLQGQVIYRDFFEFVTPLSPWVAAALFKLTGPSLFAARILQSLLMVVSGWQLYRLAGRLGVSSWGRMLPGLILILALYRKWPVYSHHWLHLPLVLAAFLLAARGFEEQRLRWWGLAGIATGLAALCIQSDGMILAVALGGAILVGCRANESPGRACLRSLGAFILGGLLPVGAAIAFFAKHGALMDVWRDIWDFTLHQYKGAGGFNDLRFGNDFTAVIAPVVGKTLWFGQVYHYIFLYAILPAMALVAAVWGGRLIWRRFQLASWKPLDAQLFFLSMFTIGSFVLALKGRTDASHLAFYAYPAILLATVGAQRWSAYFVGRLPFVAWFPFLSLWAFALTGAMLLASSIHASWETLRRFEPPDKQYAATDVIRFIKANTLPTDRIVGLPHGEFFYFFGRPPATQFTFMLPPFIPYYSKAQFDQLFDEIERENPKYVLISGELRLKPFVERLPSSYRFVRLIKSPQYGMTFPISIFALTKDDSVGPHDSASNPKRVDSTPLPE